MSLHRPGARRARRTSLALLSAVALVSPASAQSFDVLVSLVAPDQLWSEPVGDGELILHEPALPARLAWPGETLSLLAGQISGGLHHVFGDIDAVHDDGAERADGGLYLSLVSDEAGFLDGDVLRRGASGFEVFLAEADFVAATGTDGNVDVDAFHLDADGRVLFSFADNEASSFLSGDTAGVIGDGDVLSWVPGAGPAEIVHTESEIDALVSAALGSSTATGDTKGLSRDPVTGEILFVVQAPSAHDGSVFSAAGGGSLLAGHSEADMGFAGDVELDALSVVASPWPGLTVSNTRPAAGETVVFTLRGAEPGAPTAVLLALDMGPSLLPALGWGGVVLAQDTLFGIAIDSLPGMTVVPDGIGQATFTAVVPDPMTALDVVAQAVSIAWPHTASNPIVIEAAQ